MFFLTADIAVDEGLPPMAVFTTLVLSKLAPFVPFIVVVVAKEEEVAEVEVPFRGGAEATLSLFSFFDGGGGICCCCCWEEEEDEFRPPFTGGSATVTIYSVFFLLFVPPILWQWCDLGVLSGSRGKKVTKMKSHRDLPPSVWGGFSRLLADRR
jgi:hypothetical protein